ncbi:hypothetical protein HRJ45_10100 [Vibrio coralliilyticus]|uniref:ATP-grasp domain-containing protein n=1 Tax=Vibrio coralliilyticus TaxID=190893 RepID=UPI001560DAE0|nr:ATP-grasp domain-containing protein [Vibrio coralliilyticus]NRF25483.1 hypothetical protein [Vibrio coralliilyticus]NRF79454.1 hypothetical protein [Vibrio coralliilyticus]
MKKNIKNVLLFDIVPGNSINENEINAQYLGEKPWFNKSIKGYEYDVDDLDIEFLNDNFDEISRRLISQGWTKDNIHSIVAGSEAAVEASARLREKFNVNGLNTKDVRYFRNKKLMYDVACRCHSIPPIPTIYASELSIDHLEQPDFKSNEYISKPSDGCGSVDVERLTLNDLIKRIDTYDNDDRTIIQPYISGTVLHIDGIILDSQISFVPFEYLQPPSNWRSGNDFYASVITDNLDKNKVKDFILEYYNAIGVSKGIFHLELIRDDYGNLHFLEIGSRPGGGPIVDTISRAIGRDYKDVLIEFEYKDTFSYLEYDSHIGWIVLPNSIGSPNDLYNVLNSYIDDPQVEILIKDHTTSSHIPNWHPTALGRFFVSTNSLITAKEKMFDICRAAYS